MVILAWVLFRSDNISQAGSYIGYMFGITSAGVADSLSYYFIVNGASIWCIALMFSTPIYPYIVNKYQHTWLVNIAEPIGAMLLLFIVLVMICSASHNPFIYFNF